MSKMAVGGKEIIMIDTPKDIDTSIIQDIGAVKEPSDLLTKVIEDIPVEEGSEESEASKTLTKKDESPKTKGR